MFNLLYTVIIYPLILIIALIYRICIDIFSNPGFAVIGVSLAVTFLCLPLYIIAERWQHLEYAIVGKLGPKIKKIKSAFSGDEQYMILSVYYRQNHYHPIYALRSSFGILIQIPFFIAAYTFLSHLDPLSGSTFLFIHDLGRADGLLTIRGISFNILPVIMTTINIISGVIYTRGLRLKDKIQLYIMAVVFLLLLYNSPSGLVLYWTMNNVFSLIKNIFYKLKRPGIVLYILLNAAVLTLDLFLLFVHKGDLFNRLLLVGVSLIIPFLPLIIKLTRFFLNTVLRSLSDNDKMRTKIYLFSLVLIVVLTGFVIPSYVIRSSPQEFSYIESVNSPFVFLYTSFLQSFGLFLFWPISIYFLFNKKIQTIFSISALLLLLIFLINTFFFSGNYGSLSTMLTFENGGGIAPDFLSGCVNLAVIIAVMILIILLFYKRKEKIIFGLVYSILIAVTGISLVNSYTIQNEFGRLATIKMSESNSENNTVSPIFYLSTGGKNVVVIMLDRALSGFLPEILEENPELSGIYSGFTYYPNTVSFGHHTLMGVPPLFGGYEYTPEEINKRAEETLVQKHNEALLLLPRLFSENGFSVTITDPPWANYSWISDIRIYNDYPEIKAYNTKQKYTDIWLSRNHFPDLPLRSTALKRNFLWLSFFKISPLILRDGIYQNGKWWNTDENEIDFRLLLDSYAVLDLLPELTGIQPESYNTFTFLQNELTHEPNFLQAPDYIPVPVVTDRGNSKYADIPGYPVSAAAIKRLGTWLQYMKQNNVYDNTRIIIVSDHGRWINLEIFTDNDSLPFMREEYNPLLMVKDFDARFPLKTNMTFMTNGDTPLLALAGLIQNPVNPFTGKVISHEVRKTPARISISPKWMPYEHPHNIFDIDPDEWYDVKDTIFDAGNWRQAEH